MTRTTYYFQVTIEPDWSDQSDQRAKFLKIEAVTPDGTKHRIRRERIPEGENSLYDHYFDLSNDEVLAVINGAKL